MSPASVLLAIIFLFAGSEADTENNMYILKDEIDQALRDCRDGKQSHQIAVEEYEKQANFMHEPKNLVKREENLRRLQNDYESEEWDYGSRYPNNGKSWEDERDDKSVSDSNYGHKRRNNTRSSNRNLQEQNSSRGEYGNNFDSMGARITPPRKFLDDDDVRSIRELNSSDNFYDTFMSRGMKRRKRFDRLVKISNENECLSQCVFTNLKIVDDRGIPKEALLTKSIQDSVTSQQSRLLIEKQIQKCFKDLATESEDNGCSYSNMLDRCMGLQIRKRKIIEKDEK